MFFLPAPRESPYPRAPSRRSAAEEAEKQCLSLAIAAETVTE
jgi:hypothetical protein